MHMSAMSLWRLQAKVILVHSSLLVLIVSNVPVNGQFTSLECYSGLEPHCNGTLIEDATTLEDCCVLKGGRWYIDTSTASGSGSGSGNTMDCEECIDVKVGFEKIAIEVAENVGTVEICASIIEPKDDPIDVEFYLEASTMDQSATARRDYIPLTGAPLFFSDSSRRPCFNVHIVNDRVTEVEPETLSVSLSKPSSNSNYYPVIVSSEITVTILDNDYRFGFDPNEYEVSETDKQVEVCVVSTGPPLLKPLTLTAATVDGRSTSGIDYERTVVRLTFSKDQTRVCFQIPLLDDNKGEHAKFFYAFIPPRFYKGVTLSPFYARIRLADDDIQNVFGFEHEQYTASESMGSVEVCVVHKSGTLSPSTTMSVCTAAKDAIALYDYQSVVYEMSFTSESGDRQCVSIPLIDNHYPEAEKGFEVFLVTSSSGTIFDQAVAEVIITDDDVAPVPKDTCSAEDLELTAALNENQRLVVDSIVPVLFPNMTTADNDTIPLSDLYESLAGGANRSISNSGFLRFVEAIDEITAAYTESCLGSQALIPDLDEFSELLEQFKEAFDREEGREVQSLYGKMLCLGDQVSNGETPIMGSEYKGKRKRRQIPPCILARTCTFESYCGRPREECNCPEGGFDSEEIFCPCEFFDCLDKGNQLQSVFLGFVGDECLAFVVDTSGSMKDEIDFTVQIIKDFIASEEELGCYMFIPFNDDGNSPDTSVGVPLITGIQHVRDLQEFVTTLETAFQPNSGGDCPEYSYNGIMMALQTLLNDSLITEVGSQVIVLTDAPSKGDLTAEDIISEARLSEVCIHFFLAGMDTFNCFQDSPGSVNEYKHISDETGGTVVESSFEFSNFVKSYRNTPCKFLPPPPDRRKRNVVEEGKCHVFRVSTLASLLKLTAQTTLLTVTVRRPNGTETIINAVNPKAPEEKLAQFSEASPLPGEWTVCVDEGSLEISPEVQVSMDVTPLYFAQDGDNTTYLTPTPPPGCTTARIAIQSSRSDSIYSTSVQLLDDSGITSTETVLDKCGSSWTGNLTTPATGTYTYQLEGQDTQTNPFVYFTRRTVTFSSGDDYFQFGSEDSSNVTAEIGDFIILSFKLTSSNRYGSTNFQFAVEELDGFSRAVEPQAAVVARGESVEVVALVRVSSSRIEQGSSHIVTVTASNGCTTLFASRRIVLTAPPTMAPVTPSPDQCDPLCQNGGTCIIIMRGGREFARCNCPSGFRGRGCETPR